MSQDLRYSINVAGIYVENENGEELSNDQYLYHFGIVEEGPEAGGLYVNMSLDREDAAYFELPLIVYDVATQTNEQMDESKYCCRRRVIWKTFGLK